jgi:hypothetical protein
MLSVKCKGGYLYKVSMSDIEHIGYFYGKNGNENIKNAYARVKKERGRAPDFFMNAELFDFGTRKAASDVVCGGNVHRLTESYGLAFPDNNRAVFSYKNNVKAKDYIGAYPVLVRNGKAESSVPSGIGGSRGRTALCVSGNDLYIALIPDGGNDATLAELRTAFLKAGVDDAINLDGGGSTQYYSPLGNHYTGRNLRGFVGIWLKESEPVKSTPVNTVAADVRTVNVKASSSLNVRKGPGILYGRIGKMYRGNKVTVLETKGTWCRIGEGRWVSSLYLKK